MKNDMSHACYSHPSSWHLSPTPLLYYWLFIFSSGRRLALFLSCEKKKGGKNEDVHHQCYVLLNMHILNLYLIINVRIQFTISNYSDENISHKGDTQLKISNRFLVYRPSQECLSVHIHSYTKSFLFSHHIFQAIGELWTITNSTVHYY